MLEVAETIIYMHSMKVYTSTRYSFPTPNTYLNLAYLPIIPATVVNVTLFNYKAKPT